MTKVKVQGAFFHKSSPRPFPFPLISDPNGSDAEDDDDDDDDDDDEDEEEPDHEYEFESLDAFSRLEDSRILTPFGTVNAKRKRGPRYAPYWDSWGHGESYSDSAMATSSSERSGGGDDDDDDDEERGGGRGDGADSVPIGSSAMAMGHGLARRGSARPKVIPSKFREEGRSQGNYAYPSEVNSFLGKNKTSTKHAFARDCFHNEELDSCLQVLRKIMRMEAAEPFNSPVDPIALGIPDYFHVVKRPMDLGTICKRLESGSKYRNSRDVYEDVQLVWNNCRIYNQKGDPILDLLGRVKKNFSKYWIAAGLYTDKTAATYKYRDRSPDAFRSEYGFTNMKQMDMRDDIRSETSIQTVNEVELATSSRKRSGFTEQQGNIRKPTKIPPVEVASGLHGEQEAGFNILNDDLETFFRDRGGPSIISVYKSHKKKMLEQQVHVREAEQSPGANKFQYRKYKGSDSYMVQGNYNFTSKKYKEFDSDVTVENQPHRVSGTGHHKAGCMCVVCSGARRKLGRDDKHRNYGSKSIHGISSAEEAKDGYRTKKSMWEEREKRANSHEDFMDVTYEGDIGTEEELMKMEHIKGYSRAKAQLQSRRDGLHVNSRGILLEDAEEQFGDTLDAETYRDEGGFRYYRASYEMPLRKINPTVLDMGQRLFGQGSPWTNGRSLGKLSRKTCSENPVLSSVSVLLSGK